MTDLLVIGGGPAGVAAAQTAVRMGAGVCLAERALTCSVAHWSPAACAAQT